MPTPFHDIRGEGFDRRVPADDALDRLLSGLSPLNGEPVATWEADGRVPATTPTPPPPAPATRIARRNGVALRAERTYGASVYDPAVITEAEVTRLSTGEPLPAGTDAVLPFGSFRASGGLIEVLTALAPGEGVMILGTPADDPATRFEVPAGRPLTPWLMAGLTAAGIERLSVHRRPRVALVMVGSARRGPADQIGAAITAAIIRDGGIPLPVRRPEVTVEAVADALRDAAARDEADMIVTVGRTGSGPDDVTPPGLALAGRVDAHGIAMRPGGSTALGRIDGRPVVSLPGQPVSALVAHSAFVVPTIHLLSGRVPPPEPVILRTTLLSRKIVSEPGMLDVVPIRIDEDGMAVPMGDPGQLGPAALSADGVILIEAGGEGLRAGSHVTVRGLDGPLLGDVEEEV